MQLPVNRFFPKCASFVLAALLAPACMASEPTQQPSTLDPAAEALSSGVGRAESTTEAVDDGTVQDNVHAALRSNPEVSARVVEVATDRGVVTLTGRVADVRDQGRLIQVVQAVKGVKLVRNRLTPGGS